jgi:ADP-ribose pyrophosphatase YjhB (NUDIX family)
MLRRQTPTQHICVSCVVKNNGRVLVIRGSEYLDQSARDASGYFSLPRFTLRFGTNPEEIIEKELREQFNQEVDSMRVLAVQEIMQDRYNQTVELAYEVTLKQDGGEYVGRYAFVQPNELEQYVFPDEIAWIQRLLS